MDESETAHAVFPSAEKDAGSAKRVESTPQTRSSSYRLAYTDRDFLLRNELRPVGLQLELLKPELLQQDNGVHSTVVVFGRTSIPDAEVTTKRLREAEMALAASPTDLMLSRKVEIARRILNNATSPHEACR